MQEETSEDLFKVRLNENGIGYIRRAIRIINFWIVVLCLLSVSYIISGIYYLTVLLKVGFSRLPLTNQVYPFAIFVVSIVNLSLGVISYRFVNTMKKSAEINDESGFNHAFRFLYRYYLISLIGILVNLVSMALVVYNILNSWNKIY